MSWYGDDFSKRPQWCKNYKKGHQGHNDYVDADKNSKEKNLHMVPCCAASYCRGYVFAGSDSGRTPFCYNFERKQKLISKIKSKLR